MIVFASLQVGIMHALLRSMNATKGNNMKQLVAYIAVSDTNPDVIWAMESSWERVDAAMEPIRAQMASADNCAPEDIAYRVHPCTERLADAIEATGGDSVSWRVDEDGIADLADAIEKR